MTDEYLSRPGTIRDNFAYWLQGQADTFGETMDIEPIEMYKSKIATQNSESVKKFMREFRFFDFTKLSGMNFHLLEK